MLKEYRIPLPLTVDEYHSAQLFMTAKASEDETKDGEGIEVLKNEPLDCPKRGKCQYTLKKIHLASRIPRWIRAISSGLSKLCLVEESWNQYPVCETRYTCDYLGDRFSMIIHTIHAPDSGTQENIHKMEKKQLKQREVVHVDIRDTKMDADKYDEALDPNLFVSSKTGRGPLTKGWEKTAEPIMCCYKSVDITFKWWGLQTKVENFIHGAIMDLFMQANNNAYCWIDSWQGMTMEDIRAMEAKTAAKLHEALHATPETPKSKSSKSNSRSSKRLSQKPVDEEQKHVGVAGEAI